MAEPQLRLLMGDAYLCERALAARHQALQAQDPSIERLVLFADEADIAALDVELRTCSLFSLGRHFIVRRAEAGRHAPALANALRRPIPAETFVSLLAEPLRATHPVAKQSTSWPDGVLQLPTPKGQSLQRQMREIIVSSGLRLSASVTRILCSACGDDLGSLQQELEKLRAFSGGGVVQDADAHQVCYNHAEASIYPLYDRLGERKLSDALRELDTLREDPGRVVAGILRHLTRLVMVRVLIDHRCPPEQIASKTGMQPWMCRRFIEQARGRSLSELAPALRAGVEWDQRIKQGRVAPADALMQCVFAASGATGRQQPSQG